MLPTAALCRGRRIGSLIDESERGAIFSPSVNGPLARGGCGEAAVLALACRAARLAIRTRLAAACRACRLRASSASCIGIVGARPLVRAAGDADSPRATSARWCSGSEFARAAAMTTSLAPAAMTRGSSRWLLLGSLALEFVLHRRRAGHRRASDTGAFRVDLGSATCSCAWSASHRRCRRLTPRCCVSR